MLTCGIARLLHTISKRIARRLERGGFLVRDPEHDYLDFEPAEALDQLIRKGSNRAPRHPIVLASKHVSDGYSSYALENW